MTNYANACLLYKTAERRLREDNEGWCNDIMGVINGLRAGAHKID